MLERREQLGSTTETSRSRLDLVVIFTTAREALSALKAAGAKALELGARTRIIVPHPVPYPLPIERPPADPRIRVRELESLCEAEGVEASVEIRLCRNAVEAVKDALMSGSVVLIGGKERWLSRDWRMARGLRRSGHHVLFIPSRVSIPRQAVEKGGKRSGRG